MKKFSHTQIQLLSHLNDGTCRSGNELGNALCKSRTAVWKQINQLIELGVPIEKIPHQGYRLLTPLKLLSEEAIRDQLKINNFKAPLAFHLFASLDSTNLFLKNLPRTATIDICCAEKQTAGRGRFNRHWYSPFGENIYCSTRWRFDCDLSRLSGLSLVVSLAIYETLTDFGFQDHIRIKWPNDILWCNQKLCGSLIEIVAESNSDADVIIGIGLNVNSQVLENKSSENLPDKPWSSLFEITGEYIDRNKLIAHLILHLHQFLQQFLKEGFTGFLEQWHAVDYLLNKTITVSHLTGSLTGKANGVTESGQLILIDEDQNTHYLSSGDTSLHALER